MRPTSIGLAALLLAGLTGCSVSSFGEARGADFSLNFSNTDLEVTNSTSEVCTELMACDEAWTTQYGTYMYFQSLGEAKRITEILGGDASRWEGVVLDMSGHDLSFEDRAYAVDILFDSHDWG